MVLFSDDPPLCSPSPSAPITSMNTHAMHIFAEDLWFRTLIYWLLNKLYFVSMSLNFVLVLHFVSVFHFAVAVITFWVSITFCDDCYFCSITYLDPITFGQTPESFAKVHISLLSDIYNHFGPHFRVHSIFSTVQERDCGKRHTARFVSMIPFCKWGHSHTNNL